MITNIYKAKYLTCVFALLIFLSSCEDFLDKIPTSKIPPEKYFNEAAHLEAYVNNLYPAIVITHGNTYTWGLFEEDKHTDNQAYYTYSSKYIPGQFLVPENSNSGYYYFNSIYDCNYFFENVLPKYEKNEISGTKANIDHFIGEVYFLRAYEYFRRLIMFGDFPIVTECLPDELGALVEASKRSPRNEVARFIISDLDKAIELMHTKIEPRRTRTNKEAALLLKSRVALFEGTFLKYFKGTAFVPKGTDWPGFSVDYNRNYEYPTGSIEQEINYFLDIAINAAKEVGEQITLTNNTGIVPQSDNLTSPNLVAKENPYLDMFGCVDMSVYPEVLLWREYNVGLKIVHSVPAGSQRANFSAGPTRGMVDGFLMRNGLPIYANGSGYHGDDYIADVRKDRDGRLNLFLKEPGQKNILIDNGVGTQAQRVEPYPAILLSDRLEANTTGYTLRKGGNFETIQSATAASYTGALCLRGVEALLNYMEAYYERHGTLDATARSYWTQIRSRALVDTDIDKTIANTDITQEAKNDWGAYSAGKLLDDMTLYNIRRERRCEMMAEGLHMMDLTRWRAMDQMIDTPYHIEGFKLWGKMQDWYKDDQGNSLLIYGLGNSKSNVSSPDLSQYIRPYEILANNPAVNGYRWAMAHYLRPLSAKDILITSQNNKPSTSPLYQNPGWSTEASSGALY